MSDDEFERHLMANERVLESLSRGVDEQMHSEASKMRLMETPISCIIRETCAKLPKKLSPEDQLLLNAENQGVLRELSPFAFARLVNLTDALVRRHVFVYISNPVPKGHAVRFKLVQGKAEKIAALAARFGVRALEGQFEVDPVDPTPRSLARDMTRNRAGLIANPDMEVQLRVQKSLDQTAARASAPFAKKLVKPLSNEQKERFQAENEQAYQQLDPKVHEAFRQFLNKLYTNRVSIWIKLKNPIRNGHIIDYHLVRGNVAVLGRVAKKFGLKLTFSTIEAPGAEGAQTAEEGEMVAEEVHKFNPKTFEVDTNNDMYLKD